MNRRTIIKRIAKVLATIPHAHDGLGKTASVKGALNYNQDMREIGHRMNLLAMECDDLTIQEIDKRLMDDGYRTDGRRHEKEGAIPAIAEKAQVLIAHSY